ncbi:Laeverin [Arthrobotrys entomopaga]|nr:Laeverin [Arthrobotrys entomopaga]
MDINPVQVPPLTRTTSSRTTTIISADTERFSTQAEPKMLVRSPGSYDPNTQSNYLIFYPLHVDVSITIDFDNKKFHGDVTTEFECRQQGTCDEILLDTRDVEVKDVEILKGGELKGWSLGEEAKKGNYGRQLKIELVKGLDYQDRVVVKIPFSTTEKSAALQWLTPEQTTNGKFPYVFSQCEPTYCRTIFPCVDTPAAKSTFIFSVRSPLPVLCSGLQTTVGSYDPKTRSLLYGYEQKVPIPAYLFALASGDIAGTRIGPRSWVWGAAEELVTLKAELDGEVEKFISIAEKLTESEYAWGTYNVLILPPSFPFGGMENPVFTYATPSIISGDKENIDVIAHELAHSWSGNLVTNATFQDFWLNEGWTVYLERRIGAAIHGEKFFDFASIIGWKSLEESVDGYGPDHEFTKLVPNLVDQDPDDAFSSIPYDKGFTFLRKLDKTVGREKWDKFIPHYFKTFRGKSLTSKQFKETLLAFFQHDKEAHDALTSKIDWDKEYYSPGLPEKPDFDTSMADICYELAKKWKNKDLLGFDPSPSDMDSWTASQKVVFLDKLLTYDPFSKKDVDLMGEVYGFAKSGNMEVVFRFYGVALKAKHEEYYEQAAAWVKTIGRMKYCRPTYRSLAGCDRELAVKTFREREMWYHPLCRAMVKKDLGLD